MNQVEIRKKQIEVCSHALGLITLLVLGGILGDNGIAYVAAAAEGFGIFWMLTGAQVADVLGKMIWNRMSRGQYKNVARMRSNVMRIELAIGLIGSILMFVSASFLAEHVFLVPYCVSLLMILSPVIFLRTISSVVLGYFQGEGTLMPTVVSFLLRQIAVFGFSLLFAKLLGDYGIKVSVLLRQEDFVSMYGGMGVSFAIVLAELLVLLFLAFLYRVSKSERKKAGEGMRTTENFSIQARVLFVSLLPKIGEGLLRMFPLWCGLILFRRSMPEAEALLDYGVFYGKYIALTGIVILPLCALLYESAVKAASRVRRDDLRVAGNYFMGGIHMGMVFGMYFSVFLAVMAPQMADIFCGDSAGRTVKMFQFGSFVILLAVLQVYFCELLGMIGKKLICLGSLVVYDAVFVVSLILLLKSGTMGVMALVDAGIFSALVYVLAAGFLLIYMTGIRVEWIQSIAIPAGCSCVAGLVMLFIAKIMAPHLGSPVTAIVSLLVSLICYFGLLFVLRNFDEQELNYLPGGKFIYLIENMLRML